MLGAFVSDGWLPAKYYLKSLHTSRSVCLANMETPTWRAYLIQFRMQVRKRNKTWLTLIQFLPLISLAATVILLNENFFVPGERFFCRYTLSRVCGKPFLLLREYFSIRVTSVLVLVWKYYGNDQKRTWVGKMRNNLNNFWTAVGYFR